MSFVTQFVCAPSEMLGAVAVELPNAGSVTVATNVATSVPVSRMAPAAADEMSALPATDFVGPAGSDERIGAQAPAGHDAVVTTLVTSGDRGHQIGRQCDCRVTPASKLNQR
jgi:PE family